MINFTNQTTQIAQRILDHISYEPLVIPAFSSRINVLNCDPFLLLHGLSNLQPGQVDLNFCDLPRASASGPVMLYCINEAGEVINRHFELQDNDYFTTLSANLIVIARLVKRTLAPNGVVGFTTNWQHYTFARTAFDITFGSKNCLGEMVYQTRQGGGNDAKHMSVDHESVIFYGLSIANVSRFQVPKTEEELAKYKQEDERGRYTWDTFIRKQAKMYYPIECPDGTYLEHDEDGNRISWLRSKERFEIDLAAGEVEFRQIDGKWKLYYKDRIKDLKILRSIALSSADGSEIFETLTSEDSMADLLTKHGSAELKSIKVPYSKSSKFYSLIFNAVGLSAECICVPFQEFGSGALGLLASRSNASLITSVTDDFLETVRGRLSELIDDVTINAPDRLSLDSLVSDENYTVSARIYAAALECRSGPTTKYQHKGFFEGTESSGTVHWFGDNNSLSIVYVGNQDLINDVFADLNRTENEIFEYGRITIHATCAVPDTIITMFGGQVDVEVLPEKSMC